MLPLLKGADSEREGRLDDLEKRLREQARGSMRKAQMSPPLSCGDLVPIPPPLPSLYLPVSLGLFFYFVVKPGSALECTNEFSSFCFVSFHKFGLY